MLNDTVFGAGSGSNQFGETYVFDFDSGRSANNALKRIADNFGGSWSSSLGLGDSEALIAGGDSGGGDFVWNGSEWLVSGVHSYGWGLCGGLQIRGCDRVQGTNSSFGDLSGSTAVFSHVDWINSVTAVPEPETCALLLAGLAGVIAAARRRPPPAATPGLTPAPLRRRGVIDPPASRRGPSCRVAVSARPAARCAGRTWPDAR